MKKEILCFGASVIIISLTLLPAVNGTPLNLTKKFNTKTRDTNWNEIYAVLETHQEEIEEINQYVNKYIDRYGYIDWNFALPDELQVKFDSILEEIGIEPEETVCDEQSDIQNFILSKPWGRLVQQLSPLKLSLLHFNKIKDSAKARLIIREIGEEEIKATKSTSVLDWDIEMGDVWLSTKPSDWEKEYVIGSPTLGQKVYFYCDFYTYGVGELPACCIDYRLDGKLYGESCGHVLKGGKHYMVYWSEPWKATGGTHTVAVELDSQNDVLEYDEDNNEGTYQFTVDDGEDGITKLDIKYYTFQFIWTTIYIAIVVNLWMSHSYIVNNLNPATGMGIAGITLLLIGLGFKTLGLTWIFAAWIIGSGINDINNKDHGRGVYIEFSFGLIGPGWPPKITPQ